MTRTRRDIIFWISGVLLLLFTLTVVRYAATFLLSENRALQEEMPPSAEPVRFDLGGLDELGISGTDTGTIENAATTEGIPKDADAEGE